MYFTSLLNSSKILLLGYARRHTHTHVYLYIHTHIYTLLFYIIYSPDDGSGRAETCLRNIMLNNRVYVLRL